MTRSMKQAEEELLFVKSAHMELNHSVIERQGRISGLPSTAFAIKQFAKVDGLLDELRHCMKAVEAKFVAVHMLDGSIVLMGKMLDSVKEAHGEAWELVREWCESLPAGANGFGHKVPMGDKIESLGALLEAAVRKATRVLEEDDVNKKRVLEIKAELEALEDERAATRLSIVRRRDAVNNRPSACDMLDCAFLQEGLKARGDLAQFDSETPGADLREELAAIESKCLSPRGREMKVAELSIAIQQIKHHHQMVSGLDVYFDACLSLTEMQDRILDAGKERVELKGSIDAFCRQFEHLVHEWTSVKAPDLFTLGSEPLRQIHHAYGQMVEGKQSARELVAQCQDRDSDAEKLREDRARLNELTARYEELLDEIDSLQTTTCDSPVEEDA